MLQFQVSSRKPAGKGTISDMPSYLPTVFSDKSRYEFVKVSYTNANGDKGHWRSLVHDKLADIYMDYRIDVRSWFYLDEWKAKKLGGCTDFSAPVPYEPPAEPAREKPARKNEEAPAAKPAKADSAGGFIGPIAPPREKKPSPVLKAIPVKAKEPVHIDEKVEIRPPADWDTGVVLKRLTKETKHGGSMASIAKKYCDMYGVDFGTVLGVLYNESRFVPNKVNIVVTKDKKKDEVLADYYYGAGQIKPSTAKLLYDVEGKKNKYIFNLRDYPGKGYKDKKASDSINEKLSPHDEAELMDLDKNIHGVVKYLSDIAHEHPGKDASYILTIYGGDLKNFNRSKGASHYSKRVTRYIDFIKLVELDKMDTIPQEIIIEKSNEFADAVKKTNAKASAH